VSVERILEYTELTPEASLSTDLDISVGPVWKKGNVDIKNLKIRYRESLPPALKNISLSIKGGERIGVVGRTGSGKSTLYVYYFPLLFSFFILISSTHFSYSI